MAQRKFETGATRNADDNKLDLEGFLSPLVIRRFGQYMHKNRKQEDGSIRASDNWQQGIPREAYMKSLLRHMLDVWLAHRGHAHDESLEDGLCAIIFNAQGMLHEILKSMPTVEAAKPFGEGYGVKSPLSTETHTYISSGLGGCAMCGRGREVHPTITYKQFTTVCQCNDLTHTGYVPRKGKVCGKCGGIVNESEGAGV